MGWCERDGSWWEGMRWGGRGWEGVIEGERG